MPRLSAASSRMTQLRNVFCFKRSTPLYFPPTPTKMAETDVKPKRKSVAFSEDTKIVDANGDVTTENGTTDKTTAESHSGMPLTTFPSLTNNSAPADKEVDEVTDLFKGLAKKKKSKKPKEEEEAVNDDGEFDPSALKKKKKKKVKPAEDDFEAKLAEAGVDETPAEPATEEQEGDLEKGTGIWQHDATQPISYNLLLTRFFNILQNHHPDLLSSAKSYKIPPPQCLREGNKKTIFANMAEICKRMKRQDEHVMQFLFAELGTTGSVDGSRRLVIRGRFQQKQIENVLRRYIGKFLTPFKAI